MKHIYTIIVFFSLFFFNICGSLEAQELQDLFIRDTRYDNRNGPLITKTTAVWQMLNLNFQAIESTVPPKGTFRIGIQWTLGNFFVPKDITSDRRYILETDTETYTYNFDIMYSITDWYTVGVELMLVHHGSGFMDPYIQSFHKTTSSPNGGREYYHDNSFSIFLIDRLTNTYIINVRSKTFGFGDTVLKNRFHIFHTKEREFGIGAVFAIKFPTGDSEKMRGSGNFDFGFGIPVEIAPFRWWIIYVNAFYIINLPFIGGVGRNFTIDLANRWQVVVSSEFIVSRFSSLILQINLFNSPWNKINYDRISGMGVEIYLGFKYRISKNITFQFFIAEELDPWAVSDITFNFSLYFTI